MTKSEVKAACMEWLREQWELAPADERKSFKEVAEDDLILFHHGLGRDMRNSQELWAKQEIIGHPDDFSMSVIYDFWVELNEV